MVIFLLCFRKEREREVISFSIQLSCTLFLSLAPLSLSHSVPTISFALISISHPLNGCEMIATKPKGLNVLRRLGCEMYVCGMVMHNCRVFHVGTCVQVWREHVFAR